MVALLDSLSRSIRNTGPSTHIEPDRRDQLKIGTSTGLTTQSQPSKKRPGHFPITPHLPPSIPFIPRAENDFDVGSVQINSSARTDTDPFAKVTSYAPVEPVVSIYDKFKSSAPPTLTSPPPPKHSTSPVRDPPPPVPRKHAHRREYSVGTVAKQTVVITATDDPSHKSTHSKVNTATSDHSKKPTRKASKDTLRQGNTSTTHRAKEKPVIPIVVATQPTPPKALHSASVDTLIPTPSTVRPYVQSRSSSFADVSRPSSPEGADSPLFDFSIPVPALPTHISRNRPSSMSRSTSANRPSPLNPNASVDTGYDTSSTTGKSESRRHRSRPQRSHDILEEMPELHEDYDTLRGMRGDAGVLASLAAGGTNLSTASFGSKVKADKVLGLDPHAKLASFYLVSGLPKNLPEWSFADTEATRGVHFAEDSMEMFWRPDILGSCFSGQQTEDWMRSQARARKESKASSSNYKPDASMINGIRGVHVPDAGPDGPRKLITKTLKFAHPRDIEVINSSLNPPTTCHAFTFTLPKHDTLATIARTRLDSSVPHRSHSHVKYNSITSTQEDTHMSVHDSAPPSNVRNMSSATELTFYGVTMTVWTYAGHERSIALKKLKEHRERVKNGTMDSLRSDPQQILTKMSTSSSQYTHGKSKTQNNGKKPRTSMPWGMSRGLSDGEVTASETEAGVSDSDFDGPLGRRAMFRGVSAALDSRGSGIDSLPEDAAVVFDDAGDCFFVPYAITLVSRHPIYDVMQDFLRLSWARYSKNAKQHMTQVCRMLNHETPRPGELYRLPLTVGSDEPVSIEATMPGALDFERGIVKVDFQLWPLFQALDVDHILTCVEVALSNTGRIVFCSKHPAMLNVAVNTLKYIVELRGWNGIAVPMIHARDMTFVIEDPGPYIIGMSSECKYMVTMPSEVVVVDIDTNSLSCKSPPVGVITPRPRREKAKQKVFAALGQEYPLDRTIPIELKISYPKSSFRNLNKFIHGPERPSYLGERLRLPSWWHHTEVITAFDKIMLNKHKKPSLIQRLTKSGMARQQAQLTVGEQLARTMMRRRALHYVETRDDLELKIGKINKKLLKLTQEGEHWRKQFESFERYADKLTSEANDLKIKIEREKREAKRLSNIASEQTKANEELEEKLKNTETARAEAMRQLSDMHHSIQELEKEREEIMDMFETQINHALEGLPIGTDAGSRPSTPSGSTISSPRLTHRVRPGTSDTQRSTLSRLTTDSRAISVIGAATGAGETPLRKKVVRPGTAGTVSTEMAERNLGHKTDQMSLRIASIQAKLEMALSTITAPHESSVAESQSQYSGDHTDDLTDGDDVREGLGLHNVQAHRSADSGGLTEASDAETEEDSAVVATPTASRRPSKSTGLGSAQAADAPPVPRRGSAAKADESPTLKSDKQLEDDVNNDRPLSPEYHSAVETVSPEHDTTNRQSILSEDGSIVASDNSMTPTKYPIVQRARTPSGVNGNGEGGIGIIKRGVSLRIKKKDGDSSKSGTPPRSRNASRPTSALGHRDRDHGTEEKRISSQHQRQNQGDDQDDGSYDHPMDDKDNGHVKLSTEDSVRSTMMLISPSNSVDGIDRGVGGGVKILNHGSREHELGVEVTDGDELEQEFGEDNKRLSMMSNSTVAFGQMT